MGIKRRISLGFVVIGLVLFFSSLIAIFEYSRMSNYVSRLIDDNISSINISRDLIGICDEYNSRIVTAISSVNQEDVPDLTSKGVFESKLNEVRDLLKGEPSKEYCDSVKYIYAAYMQVVSEAETVWESSPEQHKNWYFDRVKPYYEKLNASLLNLNGICQKALTRNSEEMQESFYRSIMPGIVAVAAGIIIVFLFNYFMNYYVLNPVIRMGRGVYEYNKYHKDFELKFHNSDEISDLYDSIKELMESKRNGSGGSDSGLSDSGV